MEAKQEELLRRPLYLYDLPAEVLNTLSEKPDDDGEPGAVADTENESPRSTQVADSPTESVVGSQSCSLCGLAFQNILEQRSHLKSDHHHYNLKQKLRGREPVSETEFEKLIEALDESLSGSDSSESEDDKDDDASRKETTLSALLRKQATLAEKEGRSRDGDLGDGAGGGSASKSRRTGKAPLIWLRSSVLPERTYFGVYRAMFSTEELETKGGVVEAIRKKQLAPIAMPKPNKDGTPPVEGAYKGPHVFLCMIGGGHFAAMVVSLAPRQTKHSSSPSSAAGGPLNREATVLAHKTFHRYTTRRKQGGSQSANDNAKGNAHSAGSSLRRYNEQALVEDVRGLLGEWRGLLDTADLLFVRATGSTNRRTLFGPYDGQVLRANDPRLRGFPFSTRRATQNELMRSFIELTRLKVRTIEPGTAATASSSPETSSKAPAAAGSPSRPVPPKLTEEEETALLHTTQLQALIRRSKLPALLAYLKDNALPPDFRFFPPDAASHHHAPTPLHYAAAQNAAALVTGLLTRAGADPTVRSAEGRTAAELAGERATRDAFRVARAELGEERWDWDAARVGPALRREEAERSQRLEREAAEAAEAKRRRAEEERLRAEEEEEAKRKRAAAAAVAADVRSGTKGRGKGGGRLLAPPAKTAQERREEETRGLTAEQKMRLERERRARAAEERIRRMQAASGGS